MDVLGLHHAGLSVSDFDAAAAWWAEHFGFAVDCEWGAGPLRMGIIAAGTTRIELFAHEGATAGPDESGDLMGSFGARGWKHVALTVADVDTAFADLRAAGVTVLSEPATNATAGLRYAFLRDPDGNHVEILSVL